MNKLIIAMFFILLQGCDQPKVKNRPIAFCVSKCVSYIIEDTDEPFSGPAIKELRDMCREKYKVIRCHENVWN